MFIIVNKDFSIAQIAPSTVYQGSNLANELAVFAPFSVTAYTAIEVAIALPSGEYLSPLLAFPTETQPDGFGAWSMELPSTVTAVSGTAKFSLSFIGVNNTKMVTEAAEFSVYAAVPTVPVPDPSEPLYVQILSYISEVLSRKPNWSQTNPNADDYIANKPPIVPAKNINNEVVGAAVDGTFSAEGLTVGGVNFNAKLDKATSSGTAVYAVEGSTQKIIETDASAQIPGGIPIYSDTNTLKTQDPRLPLDVVNLRYLQDQLRTKVLPTWITNIATASGANLSIPPTTSAVIRYASPAIIGEASGTALLIDDYSSISGQIGIRVSTPNTVTSVLIYGRNLFNISAVTAQVGDISVQTDSFTWTSLPSATGTFFVRCPVDIPAGATFTFSFDWIADSDVLGRVRFYNGSTEVGNTATGVNRGTFTFDQPITHINIYKNPSNTALSGVVTISNPTVNIGTQAEYTSYSAPITRTVNNGSVIVTPQNSDGVTIIPTTAAVISASYTRDSTKVINKIFDLIAELQDALAN